MIIVHILLLHVALSNRPPPSHLPFQPASSRQRPYDFWQWRSPRPYWTFVTYFIVALLVLHILLSATALFIPYTTLLGYVALTIEATLPLPQLLSNWQRRGCKGFRPSVIANWIVGDTFKMWYFFASSSGEVPWAFKICGIFQAVCDLGLGLQWFVWRDGPEGVAAVGEKELTSPPPERMGQSFEMINGGASGYGEKGTIGMGIHLGEAAGGWERQRA